MTFLNENNAREEKLGNGLLRRSCISDDGELGGGHDGHFDLMEWRRVMKMEVLIQ